MKLCGVPRVRQKSCPIFWGEQIFPASGKQISAATYPTAGLAWLNVFTVLIELWASCPKAERRLWVLPSRPATVSLHLFQLRNSAAESLSTAIPSKLQQLTSLCLAHNCIGSSGLVSLVRRLVPASRLCHLDLKNQQQPVGEEEMDNIFTTLAQTVGS